MRRGEANSLDPGDARHLRRSSSANVDSAVAIGVHGLPEERHLAAAGAGCSVDLAHHFRGRHAPLPPAHVGHDAEGAELVAAALDRDPGVDAVGPHRIDPGVVLVLVEVEIELRRIPGGRDQRRQPAIGIGRGEDVDRGGVGGERLPHVLRHAADHPQHEVRIPASSRPRARRGGPSTRCSAWSRIAQVFKRITSANSGEGAVVIARRAQDARG